MDKKLIVTGKIIKRNGRVVESRARSQVTGSVGVPWGRSGMAEEFKINREAFPPTR